MNAPSALSRLVPFLALALLPAAGLAQSPASATAQAPVGERVEAPGGAYWSISVDQLKSLMAGGKTTVVNVHIPFEGSIPGTNASIPFNQIADHIDQLPADKDAGVVLYCKTGPMSVRAARTLVGLGYTRVYTLTGGFKAWADAGNPLDQKQN
jgi:rhodanese-related sulfurtransferase